MELHHDEGREGDNFSDFTKLKPTHRYCNQKVGSKKKQSIISYEEYEFRKMMDL